MVQPIKIQFISDPGHGWAEVPMQLIRDLGIADQISSFSYRLGDTAYLEEDCDAALLIRTLHSRDIPYTVSDREDAVMSEIRSYPRYTA